MFLWYNKKHIFKRYKRTLITFQSSFFLDRYTNFSSSYHCCEWWWGYPWSDVRWPPFVREISCCSPNSSHLVPVWFFWTAYQNKWNPFVAETVWFYFKGIYNIIILKLVILLVVYYYLIKIWLYEVKFWRV